jgi:hypothetical protein
LAEVITIFLLVRAAQYGLNFAVKFGVSSICSVSQALKNAADQASVSTSFASVSLKFQTTVTGSTLTFDFDQDFVTFQHRATCSLKRYGVRRLTVS